MLALGLFLTIAAFLAEPSRLAPRYQPTLLATAKKSAKTDPAQRRFACGCDLI
jgi:hypothetical protein